MRIGFDARSLGTSQRTGIGQYVFHLLDAIGSVGAGHTFALFFPRGGHCDDLRGAAFTPVGSPIPPDIREDRFYRLWLDLYLPLRIACGRIDLFHGLSYLLPRTRCARTVVTVYDLTHEKYPQWAPSCSAEFSQRARQSARRADAVIAISEATRADILEIYGVDEGRVRVIYGGTDPCFRPIEDRSLLEQFRLRSRLPKRFICSVLSIHPRKNLTGLMRAFSILKKRRGLTHSLVVAGKDYGRDDILREAGKLGIAGDFMYLSYIPWEDLPLLYNCADLFVFPSFYEGFGLPPLEAMACGRPVLASRAGSLPEILGDAALYFDPADVEEMAGSIERVLTSVDRGVLRERGLRRAKLFPWEESARRTLRLYEELG
jgi:glycosyltransferase involved in cell wall biosynthesis